MKDKKTSDKRASFHLPSDQAIKNFAEAGNNSEDVNRITEKRRSVKGSRRTYLK